MPAQLHPIDAGPGRPGPDAAAPQSARSRAADPAAADSGSRPAVARSGARHGAPPARRQSDPVPPEQRPCPRCGKERKCIGHDVMEVVALVPAKVIVRRDLREKLACEDCDGELVRAPLGDKVVAGGRLGSQLVSELLVDKYSDGLPLHRQKERFARRTRPLDLDATGLPVLDREAAGGKRFGMLWGYVGNEDGAAYLYTSTGTAKGQRKGERGPRGCSRCAPASPSPTPRTSSTRASNAPTSSNVAATCTQGGTS